MVNDNGFVMQQMHDEGENEYHLQGWMRAEAELKKGRG